MRICVIFNPTARGDKAHHLRQRLDRIADQCTLMPTTGAGAARSMASEAAGAEFDTIVAAGGDGTVNEVLNGIADADGLERVRLAVLPVGTVNVFAREAGIPLKLEAAWATARCGCETRVDVPEMQFQSPHGDWTRRLFIQMAGCGWDARAVELVSWPLKKRIGQFAYIVAGLQTMRCRHPKLCVIHGDQRCEGELVILGNGRFYGGSFSVFHQADLHDGLLDVCVFPRVTWIVLCQYFISYILNARPRIRDQIYFQAPSLHIEGPNITPVQVDGDTAGRLPVRCTVRRSALRLLVPPGSQS